MLWVNRKISSKNAGSSLESGKGLRLVWGEWGKIGYGADGDLAICAAHIVHKGLGFNLLFAYLDWKYYSLLAVWCDI